MRVLGFLVLYFLKNTLILLKYGKPFAFLLLFFLKILFMTDRQREKQVLCREPDVGLDPKTPGSGPGPKAGTKPLSHPGILEG